MSKQKDAVWELVFELATKLNAEFTKGNTVIWEDDVLNVPLTIDSERQTLKYITDNDTFVTVIHDGTEPEWGAFKTRKEVKDFFSKSIRVLQPVKWM